MDDWEELLIFVPLLAGGIYAAFVHATGKAKPRLVAIACYCVAISLFVAALHFENVDPRSLTLFYIICSIGLTFWGARLQIRS
ncbi:MAG TPA: hypothetical protein VMT34_15030 [Aggregatilineales bacterium]|nr:hypothetical protein [Aggregatilineales bacterium]